MVCSATEIATHHTAPIFHANSFAENTANDAVATVNNSLPFFSASDWPEEFWDLCDGDTNSMHEQLLPTSSGENVADQTGAVDHTEQMHSAAVTTVHTCTDGVWSVLLCCFCMIPGCFRKKKHTLTALLGFSYRGVMLRTTNLMISSWITLSFPAYPETVSIFPTQPLKRL